MKRKVIQIDQDKCVGCGLCANACQEGAIAMVDGKAKLVKEDHCDGLGNCLPVCPTSAISFIEKEIEVSNDKKDVPDMACGCPGTNMKQLKENDNVKTDAQAKEETEAGESKDSELMQWPVQIDLLPANASCFDNAELLVAADCTAYAYADFHKDFIKGKITVIGCPKLDSTEYSEKFTEIFKHNNIKSVTVVRMEVPCCGGIESAVKTALTNSGKRIPNQVITISTDGKIL